RGRAPRVAWPLPLLLPRRNRAAALTPAAIGSPKDSMDAATLRDISDGIERLLAEVKQAVGPVAWPRLEQLLSSVVQLYGAGLAGVLELVDDEMRAKLSEDELIASLLVLHGLHPLGPEARIQRALEQMVPQAKLLGLEGGVARLAVANGGPGLSEAL